MNVVLKTPNIHQCLAHNLRTFSKTAKLGVPGAYDAEGKTTLHILNKDEEIGLMINGYSQMGFRLNNDMTILGPMAIFSKSVLSWNIGEISDVTEESLSLFKILEPKLDILVLGTGNKLNTLDFFTKLLPFSKKHKIAFEILPTDQACSTFNFLNSEGRNVAGCMIPPQTVNTFSDDEELRSKMRYQEFFTSNPYLREN